MSKEIKEVPIPKKRVTLPKIDPAKVKTLNEGISEGVNEGINIPDGFKNMKIDELLREISFKMDRLIKNIGIPKEAPNKIKLSEMSLTDLKFLKELSTETVILNNYPGGNQELKVQSNGLIVRINEELTKRLISYH